MISTLEAFNTFRPTRSVRVVKQSTCSANKANLFKNQRYNDLLQSYGSSATSALANFLLVILCVLLIKQMLFLQGCLLQTCTVQCFPLNPNAKRAKCAKALAGVSVFLRIAFGDALASRKGKSFIFLDHC